MASRLRRRKKHLYPGGSITATAGLLRLLVGTNTSGLTEWPSAPVQRRRKIRSVQTSAAVGGKTGKVRIFDSTAEDSDLSSYTFNYTGPFKLAAEEIIAKNTLGDRLDSIATEKGTKVVRVAKVAAPVP